MRRVLALFALLLAASLQARAPADSIDDFIAREMPNSGAPGLAYAVVIDGVVQSDARGEILIGGGTMVTPDTPFVIGSITKSFTATGVMQLVEAGTVGLDTEISQYLDMFVGRPSGAVTIRQLLSHTSGFSTAQGNESHARAGDSFGEDALFRQVEQIAGWDLAYAPGSQWQYSNANYQILGALIETVSGQDYASYIEAEILGPLGMDSSFVSGGQNSDPNMAVGHRPWFGTKRPVEPSTRDRIMAPAGGVIASANDMALYMAAMMNGQDDVITAQSKAAMLRPASRASPFYGFGWFLDIEAGTASHDGASPGVETLATLVPAQNKAAIVLVNAGSGIGFGETVHLRSGLSAMALGLEYEEAESRWAQKTLFISLALLPLAFLLSMVWAWIYRRKLRAKAGKAGPAGLLSLWFPLLSTLTISWVLIYLIPKIMGVSLDSLLLFVPDLAMAMIASAITGVVWAVFRLGVAYSGRQAA